MKFRVVAVGRPRDAALARDVTRRVHGDAALAAAIESYEARAERYWPLETRALRDESAGERSSDAVRKREGERILKALDVSSTVVACDERGKSMSSVAFARWLQDLRERAVDVAFVIGGAHGLDEAVRNRSTRVLALAPWTLSHDLARLILAEQLYRAGTMVKGEPYHK